MFSQLPVQWNYIIYFHIRAFFLTTFCTNFWKRVHNSKEIVNLQGLFVLTVGYVDMKTYPLTYTLFYIAFVLTIQKKSRFEPGTPVHYLQLRFWIDYVFYLLSIEKFETLTIQECKKCLLPTGPSDSNFDNSGL